jgi:hypothetical protein
VAGIPPFWSIIPLTTFINYNSKAVTCIIFSYYKKHNPEDEAISGGITIKSGKIVTNKQSCSSAWLEHYTDNVGVSSSNLLGTTRVTSERGISSAG